MVASSATFLPYFVLLLTTSFALGAGVDESCDGKGGLGCLSEDDDMGLAQLRKATHHRESSKQSPPVFVPPAALVSTAVSTGASPSTVISSITALQLPMAHSFIENNFGCGGSGCTWQASFAVLYTDIQSGSVSLELEINSTESGWTVNPAKVVVGGLSDPLPSTMDFNFKGGHGDVACPPAYSLPGPPAVENPPTGFSNCGFAPPVPNATAVAPKAGVSATLSIDVTSLIASKYQVFKVWVTPSDLDNHLWETARYQIVSWKFVQA